MTEVSPQSTPELLSLIEREWQELMRVVDRLTPEQMTRPDAGGWSPKDNLAHLAEWLHYMDVSYLQKKPASEGMGIEADKLKQLDENGINAVLFERNRLMPVPDVLAKLKRAYADAMKTLKPIPFADLLKPLRESGPDKRRVLDAVTGNTSDHFREHRETIEKALGK